jgi:hypothetical protein
MVEWKIEDKVTTITLDNATNNGNTITNLKAKLLARKNSVFDPGYFHIRCAAHIVNLVVNDGLQPIDDLISCLGNTVNTLRRLHLTCISLWKCATIILSKWERDYLWMSKQGGAQLIKC